MNDRGMAISNHVDLNTHELLLPQIFDQQELQVSIPAQAGTSPSSVPLTLTGFRSGQVKGIQIWLTKDSDTYNPLLWYAPQEVTVLYAGTIFAQYNRGTSQIWNLLDGTKPPTVDNAVLAVNPGGANPAFVASSGQSVYAILPFANPTGNDYEADVLSHGKHILNGLVNLQVTPPTTDAYTAHVAYIYNATLVFSKSSAEYRF
jgi:hypothetical protein